MNCNWKIHEEDSLLFIAKNNKAFAESFTKNRAWDAESEIVRVNLKLL